MLLVFRGLYSQNVSFMMIRLKQIKCNILPIYLYKDCQEKRLNPVQTAFMIAKLEKNYNKSRTKHQNPHGERSGSVVESLT